MGYKEEKELFVSGMTGGSITRINLVCVTAIVSSTSSSTKAAWTLLRPLTPLQTTYALWIVVHARFLSRLHPNSLKIPILEFLILVLPLLLALTSFSAHPLRLNLFLILLTLLSALLPSSDSQESTPPLSPELGKKRKHERTPSQVDTRPFARPFVTSYRAIMMVMTVLGILAVDFPFFPREFAKAETWGTSLVRFATVNSSPPSVPSLSFSQMDLGVGSFVFSLGLVSALPLLRGTDSNPYFTTIWRSFKKCLPLVALGLVRVVMVKGVDYPVCRAFFSLSRMRLMKGWVNRSTPPNTAYTGTSSSPSHYFPFSALRLSVLR